MKKSDGIIIAVIIGIACIVFLGMRIDRQPGDSVIVSMDGEVIAEYPLDRPLDIVLQSNQNRGHNHLVIADGEAKITAADCPDELCVQQKSISLLGESLICLPHKLVITVSSKETATIDALAS
ncbi:MAG: NusG domain II-containing protein [Lachnospiraceae bacterium]